MKIIFADKYDSLLSMIVPVVQPPVKFSQQNQHETFKTIKWGDIVLTGDKGLKMVEWSSFFPVNKPFYTFVEHGSLRNGEEYKTFLEEHAEIPFRLIITENFKTKFNSLVVIDSFEYEYDKVGDIAYSLKLMEFPEDGTGTI